MSSLAIFGFKALVSVQTKSIVVSNPSGEVYNSLITKNMTTLRCTCSQPFIPYSSFIQITPRFHQLCSSKFVSPLWHGHLEPNFFKSYSWAKTSQSYFQLLALFCSIAQSTISATYRTFSNNKLVSSKVISEPLLRAQAQAAVDNYISNIRTEFLRSFSMLRTTLYMNQFASGLGDNVKFTVTLEGTINVDEGVLAIPDPRHPYSYTSSCECIALGVKCGLFQNFYNSSRDKHPVTITSLITRCFPLDSVLTSTLECWFDQDCLNLVLSNMVISNDSEMTNVKHLNSNITSRFEINSTVESIVNEFFIENWTVIISYENFYKTCASTSCSYNIDERFDFYIIIPILLSAYSVISKCLYIFIPLIIRFILFGLRRIRWLNRVDPLTTQPSQSLQTNSKSESFSPLFYG